MEKEKNQYSWKQVLAISLTIALILFFTAFGVIHIVRNQNTVYADYEDLVNNPQAVVNFNQLFNNNNLRTTPYYNISLSKVDLGTYHIEGTNTNWDAFIGFDSSTENINIVSGHTYYIRTNITQTNVDCMLARVDQTVYLTIRENDLLYTPNSSFTCLFGFMINVGVAYNFNVQPTLIDLTQMFGSNDNIPNLDQCRELFITDWYAYNVGSPISLNGLNSYAEGYNNALGSFKWQASNSAFTTSAQDVNFTDYKGTCVASGGTLTVNSVSNNTYTTCYIPFNFLVTYGTNVRFGGRFTAGTDHATRHIYIGYMENQQFIVIGSESITGGSWKPMNLSFTAPTDLSGCYIWLDDQESNFTIAVAEFSVLILDTYGAIQTSYDSGWTNASTYYDTYYGVGGTGYNQIYNAGRSAGLNENNPYTFGYLMSSVIEAPLNAVLSMFNFDFMGYNFKNFITLVFTLCLIVTIVRMFMGGSQ